MLFGAFSVAPRACFHACAASFACACPRERPQSCAARAHDAVLRMYPDLPLRFIKIHGDILVSYAYIHDWAISEMHDSTAWGELRNGAKTKAGPLEAEQLSRLGNIALVS